MSISCDYLIIAHRWYLPDGSAKTGGIDRTKEYLLKKGKNVALLEHPLTTMDVDYRMSLETRLSIIDGNNSKTLFRKTLKPSSSPLRWISETMLATVIVKKHLRKAHVVMAADPLCSLQALRLKSGGFAQKSVLHCTDYADQRFSSPLLNLIYRHICGYSVSRSDFILCVSRRMKERFQEWADESRLFFFPNAPSISECPAFTKKDRIKNSVVIMGLSRHGMNYSIITQGIKKALKEHPDLTCHVIGAGGGQDELLAAAEACGIKRAFEFHGFMKRDDALRLAARCDIGLAYYSSKEGWNYYRDSLKIREYAACGLPIVCDGSTGTAIEAQEAGAAVICKDAEELGRTTLRLLLKGDTRLCMAEASREWADENDKDLYLERLTRLLEGDGGKS